MNQAIGPSGHRAIMAVALQPDPWGFDEAPVETWADILRPQSRVLLEGIKATVDPHGRVNPGALGLGA